MHFSKVHKMHMYVLFAFSACVHFFIRQSLDGRNQHAENAVHVARMAFNCYVIYMLVMRINVYEYACVDYVIW